MTGRAAIMGSLVDVRNIGVHKSVKLTIHVPEELAVQVINAFGWPTGVDPVPVAIARLHPEAKKQEPAREVRAHKSWRDMPAAAQAAIRCNEVAFQRFIQETQPQQFKLMNLGTDAERVAEIVRFLCGVKSRKDIVSGTEAFERWKSLDDSYRAWLMVAA